MNAARNLAMASALASLLAIACLNANAEQKQQLGPWEVHYVLVPTSFLKPDIAASYGVARGRDRAMLNISVLDEAGNPVAVEISGTITNLLSQQQPINFREVREGPAIYYLAEVKHTDREVLRFAVDITPPDSSTERLQFQQTMYWDGR
jgi:hypothetical protein